jgi:hypothetical protein
MTTLPRLTSADLAAMPDDGKRYQLIEGELYRREQATLRLAATLYTQDTLDTPLLPGFGCGVGRLFVDLPRREE